MLDYAALSVLAAVISEGTFERAAAVLHISPSAVSQRVRALEERLGSVLVIRSQPCKPTEMGRKLCAHFDQVRLLEADLGAELHAPEVDTITLKIAVNSDSLASWLVPALVDFTQRSGLLVELLVDDEGHTVERLRSGEVVAAITSDGTQVQGCRTTRLGDLRYLACASPAFVTTHFAEGVDTEGLLTAPYMRFDRRDDLQARWALAHIGAQPGKVAHWIPSTWAFLDLAIAGVGWGMHPQFLARPHIDTGALTELKPDTPIDVTLYWTQTRLHSAALRQLTDAVRRAAQHLL